jgi:hypothetical protein
VAFTYLPAFALPVSGLLARLSRCGDLLLLRLERNACSISLAGYPGQSAFFLTGGLYPPFFKYSKSKKKRTRGPPFFARFWPSNKKEQKEKKTPKSKKTSKKQKSKKRKNEKTKKKQTKKQKRRKTSDSYG